MPRHVSRSLIVGCAVLLVLLAANDLSHALDDGLETGLGALAAIAAPEWLVLAALMAAIVRGDRARGASAALLLGSGVILGFVVVHLVPFAPASYWEVEPTLASWLLAWLPVGVGVVVTALAWGEWRSARAAVATYSGGTSSAGTA